MKSRTAAAVCLALLAAFPLAAGPDTQWVLEQSTLTWHASHPLHQSEGVSHAARGKGVCHDGQCDFLIAVTLKSFDSGDSNRDIHMQQVARGGQYPLVSVRTRLSDAKLVTGAVSADLEIQFAGQTVQYKQVAFQLSLEGNTAKLTGTIPATLTDFKIAPPSLLAVPIKNDIPVRVETTWHKQP